MQILTGKHGTVLKITKTEERKLKEAKAILHMIAKHGDQALECDASLAAANIVSVFRLLKQNEPAMPVTE